MSKHAALIIMVLAHGCLVACGGGTAAPLYLELSLPDANGDIVTKTLEIVREPSPGPETTHQWYGGQIRTKQLADDRIRVVTPVLHINDIVDSTTLTRAGHQGGFLMAGGPSEFGDAFPYYSVGQDNKSRPYTNRLFARAVFDLDSGDLLLESAQDDALSARWQHQANSTFEYILLPLPSSKWPGFVGHSIFSIRVDTGIIEPGSTAGHRGSTRAEAAFDLHTLQQ